MGFAIGRCRGSVIGGYLDFARHALSKSRIQRSSKPNALEAGGGLDFARHALSKSRIQCSSKPNIFEAGGGLDFARHPLSKSRINNSLSNRFLFLVFLIAALRGGNQKNQKQKTIRGLLILDFESGWRAKSRQASASNCSRFSFLVFGFFDCRLAGRQSKKPKTKND